MFNYYKLIIFILNILLFKLSIELDYKIDLKEEEVSELKMGKNIRNLISIKIGFPSQNLKVKLSTSFCGLCLLNKEKFNYGYDISISKNLKVLSKEVKKINFGYGYFLSDSINFCGLNGNNKNIPFLLIENYIKNETLNFDGLIGLGFNCKNNENNLLSLLSQGKSNFKNIFSIEKNYYKNYSKFLIGNYPKNFNFNSKFYHSVKLINNNQKENWKILLHSIYFDDNDIFYINKPISIGIGGLALNVIEEFYIYIKEKYFENLFEINECEEIIDEVSEIYCNYNFDEKKIGDLHLILGKWNLKIPSKNLFHLIEKNGKKKKWFSIIHINDYEFYLPQNLIPNSNTLIFNRDKNEIGFLLE